MKHKRRHYKVVCKGTIGEAIYFHGKRIYGKKWGSIRIHRNDYNKDFIELITNRLDNQGQHLVSMLSTQEIIPSLVVKGKSQVKAKGHIIIEG